MFVLGVREKCVWSHFVPSPSHNTKACTVVSFKACFINWLFLLEIPSQDSERSITEGEKMGGKAGSKLFRF